MFHAVYLMAYPHRPTAGIALNLMTEAISSDKATRKKRFFRVWTAGPSSQRVIAYHRDSANLQ